MSNLTANIATQRLKAYLNGVLLQSERVVACANGSDKDGDDDVDSDKTMAEIRLFSFALANSVRWAKVLKSVEPTLAGVLDTFIAALPEAKDLRDMLEHEDDYLRGKGNKQGDYEQDFTLNGGSLAVNGLSPQTLVVVNEGVLIGGRLNVAHAAKKVQELFKALG